MRFDVSFEETKQEIPIQFGEVQAMENGGDLPAGYQRISCVRFSGEQIVDTGMLCTEKTKMRAVFTRDTNAAQYLYGVASDGNAASVTAYLASGGAWRFGNKSASKNVPANKDLIVSALVSSTGIDMPNSTTSINGVAKFVTIGTLLIGSCRAASGDVGAPQFDGKILLFEMWEGEEATLRLIPVRNGDGACGFWDEIRKKFHGSITGVELDGGDV